MKLSQHPLVLRVDRGDEPLRGFQHTVKVGLSTTEEVADSTTEATELEASAAESSRSSATSARAKAA